MLIVGVLFLWFLIRIGLFLFLAILRIFQTKTPSNILIKFSLLCLTRRALRFLILFFDLLTLRFLGQTEYMLQPHYTLFSPPPDLRRVSRQQHLISLRFLNLILLKWCNIILYFLIFNTHFGELAIFIHFNLIKKEIDLFLIKSKVGLFNQ